MNSQPDKAELEFTGERVIPGKTPRPLVLEHLARYRLALRLMNEGCKTLDAGCGAGYGTALLAERAALVAGMDISEEAVQYARGAFVRPNLFFARGDCRSLPFPDNSFDRVVVFEVIEHVAEQANCLREIRRVLAPKGVLILSTPNPAGPTKEVEELNPFHQNELQEHELLDLLRPHFGHVELLYQHALNVSSIESASRAGQSDTAEVVEDFSLDSPPKYFVAVCGHEPVQLPSKKLLALGDIEHQVSIVRGFRQHERDIQALLQDREARERDYRENLAAHRQAITELKEELARHVAAIEQQRREYAQNLAAHQQVIARLNQEVAAREAQLNDLRTRLEGRIAQLENEIASRRMEMEWLYRWFPTNRLAHHLLYGRNLRHRILRTLGFKL